MNIFLYTMGMLLAVNAILMIICYCPFSSGSRWPSRLWNKIKSEIGY